MPTNARPIDDAPQPPAGMTAEQWREAQQYRRLGRACNLADRALDLGFLAVMAFVLARPLDAWLQQSALLAGSWWLRLSVFFVILMGGELAVTLPLSYYAGYRLPHRFDLSNLSLAGWLWRSLKVLLLTLPFGLGASLALFWFIRAVGPAWWVVATVAFFLFGVLLVRVYPTLIEPLFYRVLPLDRPDLAERIGRLAHGTGLSIAGVYRMELSAETRKANAQLAGLGRTRRVILADTLLDHFTPDEIEVILAHEIGHHVLKHLPKLLFLGLIGSAVRFGLCDLALRLFLAGGIAPDYANLPVHALPLLLGTLFALRIVFDPIDNAISRWMEGQADAYALVRSDPAAYRSAFCKLAQQNKEDPSPPRWEVLLFYSHPPIEDRLAAAGK